MGKPGKNEIAIVADLKGFLDIEIQRFGSEPRFTLLLGFLVGVAARKKLEDLDQVPFSFTNISVVI